MKAPLPASLIQFLHPLLLAQAAEVAEKATTLERRDYKRLPWSLITPEAKVIPLADAAALQPQAALLEAWAKGEGDLWLFLERPRVGVKGHQARFWAFFAKEDAEAWFAPPRPRPLDYRPEEIHPLPQPNLREALTQQQAGIQSMAVPRQRLARLARQHALVEYFLGSQGADLGQDCLAQLRLAAADEAAELKQGVDLQSPEAESRLKGVYGVVKRFFLKASEVEREYLAKLLEPDAASRLKGLNFALTKLK